MKLYVRLFANLSEAVGQDVLEVKVPDGTRVDGLLDQLARQHAPLRNLLGSGGNAIRVAVNLEFAPRDRPLREGDEIGLIPPVGGG